MADKQEKIKGTEPLSTGKEKSGKQVTGKVKRQSEPEINWSFSDKDIYIVPAKKRRPPWMIPVLIGVLIIAFVIWLGPRLLNRGTSDEANHEGLTAESREADRVVKTSSAAIYAEPDIRSRRLYTALINEPLADLNDKPENGFIRVRLADGNTGYIEADKTTESMDSLDLQNASYRVIVLNGEKRVMSHTSRGTLLMTAPMGAELFADYAGTSTVRVILPGGTRGWMNREDIAVLGLREKLQPPANEPEKYFCSAAMSFINAQYVPGGMTKQMADLPGIIRVAAKVNGRDIPRDIEQQMSIGTGITFEYRNGLPVPDDLRPGDLLYFSANPDSDDIVSAGVMVSDGSLLYARPNSSSIGLYSLERNPDIMKNLKVVRRPFD